MVAIFHKIISFFLALLVLFTSFSFTVNKHICGGKVVNTALFVSADTCGMEMDVCKNNPNRKTETGMQKKPCCQDVSKLIQGNKNNQQAQQVTISFPQVLFLQAFVSTFILKYQEAIAIAVNKHYSPPNINIDIFSFFQVFRI